MSETKVNTEAKINGISFTDADVINLDNYNYTKSAYLLHDHGFTLAVVLADCLQDALDEAADRGKLDRYEIADDEMSDYADDDGRIAHLGNYCKPHDIESLGMIEIPKPILSFCASFNAENG